MSIRHICLLGFLMSALAFGGFSPAKAQFQYVEIADFTGDGNRNDFGTPGSKLLVKGESDDRDNLGTLAVMKQETPKYLITKDNVKVDTASLNAGIIGFFTFITLNAIDGVAISSGASVVVLTPSSGSAAGRWLIVDDSAGGGDDYLLQETGPGTWKANLYYPNWAIIYTGSLASGKHELNGHEGTKISQGTGFGGTDEVRANFDGDVNVSFRLPFDIFASLSSPTPFVSALRFLGTNDGEDMGAIRFGVQLPVFEEVEMDIESIITNDSTIYIDIYLEDANGDEIENIVILPDFSNIDSAFHPPAYIADDFAPTTSTYSNLWDGSMYGLDDLVDDVLGSINYGRLTMEDRGNGRYSVSYRIAEDNIATTGKKLISIRAVAFPGDLPWDTMADIYAAFKYYPVTGTRPIILAEWTTLPLPLPDVDPELEISHLVLSNGSLSVNIPDPRLRLAIEEQLGKEPGAPITQAELATMELLWRSSFGITNLTGLEYAIKLKRLYLYNNGIGDISPLSELTSLTEISLYDNHIRDIKPLSKLANLIYLDLHDNQISDISPLSGLTKIGFGFNEMGGADLNLSNNQIRDISALVYNPGIGEGDRVDIFQNPLSYQAINVSIPALRNRYVTVNFDPRMPAKLVIVSGNNQTGEPNTPLPNPFVVQVTDQMGKPFEGVPVTFVVTEGYGLLSNGDDVESVNTDFQGRARTTLTLGDPGLNRVRATAPNIAVPVFFEAMAKLRADFNDIPTGSSVDVGDPISGLKTHGWGQMGEINVVGFGKIGNVVEMIPAAPRSGLGMQFPSTGEGGFDLSYADVQFFMLADDVECGIFLSDSFLEGRADPFQNRSFVRFVFEPGRESFFVETSPDIEFNGGARPVSIQQGVWYHYEVRFVPGVSRNTFSYLVLVNGRSVIEGQLFLRDMDTQNMYVDFHAYLNSNSNSRAYFENLALYLDEHHIPTDPNAPYEPNDDPYAPKACKIIINNDAPSTNSIILDNLKLIARDYQGGEGIQTVYIDGDVDEAVAIPWHVDETIAIVPTPARYEQCEPGPYEQCEPDLNDYPALTLEHSNSGRKYIYMIVRNQKNKLSITGSFPVEEEIAEIRPFDEIYLNVETSTIRLVNGLNFISVPLNPGNWNLENLRATINQQSGRGSVRSISYTTGGIVKTGLLPYSGILLNNPNVTGSNGYYVRMVGIDRDSSAEIIIEGTPWVNNVTTITLVRGLNLIGLPLNPGNWKLENLRATINQQSGHESVRSISYTTGGIVKTGLLSSSGILLNNPNVTVGSGYLVDMDSDVTITIGGSPWDEQ